MWHWDPAFVRGRWGSPGRDPHLAGRSRPARSGAAAALTLPTLLVRGRSSDLLSEEGARAFLEAVPHAEFADVAGAGHMVAGDRNDVFNQAILEFLADNRPEPERTSPTPRSRAGFGGEGGVVGVGCSVAGPLEELAQHRADRHREERRAHADLATQGPADGHRCDLDAGAGARRARSPGRGWRA